MQPLNDRVLIQRIGDVERIGSIYLPDSARERSYKGIVIAVGPGKWHPSTFWKIKDKWEWLDGWREKLEVKPGQTVLFNSKWNDFESRDAEQQLPVGADPYLHMVQEADIIGVLADA